MRRARAPFCRLRERSLRRFEACGSAAGFGCRITGLTCRGRFGVVPLAGSGGNAQDGSRACPAQIPMKPRSPHKIRWIPPSFLCMPSATAPRGCAPVRRKQAPEPSNRQWPAPAGAGGRVGAHQTVQHITQIEGLWLCGYIPLCWLCPVGCWACSGPHQRIYMPLVLPVVRDDIHTKSGFMWYMYVPLGLSWVSTPKKGRAARTHTSARWEGAALVRDTCGRRPCE